MNRWIGRILAVMMGATALVGVTTVAAEAHSIALSGTKSCLPTGWKVLVRVDVTNTPSSGTDSQSETKAMKPTGAAGTLSTAGGQGVMFGSQVILNAWYEHRNNWTGVKYRTGNYVDYYTITLPFSVSSVETEVQIDWKGWGSLDPNKTFTKPSECVPPHDECPQLEGNQPDGFQCVPLSERRERTTEGSPDCVSHTVTIFHQSQGRVQEWRDGSWSYPAWPAAWSTDDTTTRTTTAQECPPNEPPPVTPPPVTPPPVLPPPPVSPPTPKPRHVKTRVVVVDKCNCFHDSVKMKANKHKVKVYSHRVNKTTWRFVVIGKIFKGRQMLLPNKISGNSGWSESQVYTVHTTSKPCPCRKSGTCSKQPRPKNPCPVGRGGLVCK